MICDLKKKKPRHPKRPQLPPGEAGTPTKRIVHIAVYKPKLQQKNNYIKFYEQFLNQLLVEQAAELDIIIKKMNTSITHSPPPRS